MNISDLIDNDIECVREYCTRLIAFAEASSPDFVPAKSRRTKTLQYLPINIAHLVRPDLISNMYALLDFRLKTLCEHHHRAGRAAQTFAEFRRNDKGRTSDLARYKKYFQTVASIDLQPVQESYKHIDKMRRVRNAYMHSGGYADEETASAIGDVPGVYIAASLLIVTNEYVHASLDHVATYLNAIAQAY